MAEYPALPLWTDAYLADTTHLTAEQHGAYLLLLFRAWRRPDCALPNDDAFLARVGAVSDKTWAAIKPVVLAFFKLGTDGLWRQGRLTDERSYMETKRKQQSDAGKSSGRKRQRNARSTDVQTPLQPKPNEPPTPLTTPTTTAKEDIPLTPLEELNGSPSKPSAGGVEVRLDRGPTFLDLIALWPRKDGLPDNIRREWFAAEEQGATGESIMAAARKYLALPEVKKTEPNYLPKLEKWLEGGGWKNIGATIDAFVLEAARDRDATWLRKFVAEAKRYPAVMFPLSVRTELGANFNGMQTYGPTELIAEYESRGIPVPVWLDPLRLPTDLRRSA